MRFEKEYRSRNPFVDAHRGAIPAREVFGNGKLRARKNVSCPCDRRTVDQAPDPEQEVVGAKRFGDVFGHAGFWRCGVAFHVGKSGDHQYREPGVPFAGQAQEIHVSRGGQRAADYQEVKALVFKSFRCASGKSGVPGIPEMEAAYPEDSLPPAVTVMAVGSGMEGAVTETEQYDGPDSHD